MPILMGLDLETYSSAPLPRCGVYRYCDAPDFEILLFSYAFDDEPVQTIDLARGETLPKEVISALEDPDIIKVAYNAQFDLNFLYYLLKPLGLVSVLRKPRFLDALTVYRDRRDYPHKLCNAIEAYGLTEAENSHRAVDDARATVLLLEAMAAEKDDLMRYIDLFGTHPKYGMSGKKIASVTYCPQPYDRRAPLYELAHTM